VLSPGRRCVDATRFHHRLRGVVHESSGPLELRWDDGEATSFDIWTDWSLKIIPGPWPDPFADAAPEELPALESEVGIWVARAVAEPDALATVIGQMLRTSEPERNEMGELDGVRLSFDSVTVRLFGWEGELRAEVV